MFSSDVSVVTSESGSGQLVPVLSAGGGPSDQDTFLFGVWFGC